MNSKTLRKLVSHSLELIDLPVCNNKHFTFILRRNAVVCYGWNNKSKTHPAVEKFDYKMNNIHSEFHAIKRFPYCPEELAYCSLVNVRVNSLGEVYNSKPCSGCQRLLKTFEFKSVLYTVNGGSFEELN